MRRCVTLAAVVALTGMGWSTPARSDGGSHHTLSLESLLEAGRQSHPSLSKRPLLNDSLALERAKIERAFWPQLSIGGKATWQSDVPSINIPVPGVDVSPPSKDQYSVTLDLQQTLWDGGLVSEQKHLASTRSRLEHEKVNLDWYQVRGRILTLYFAGVVQQELRDQAQSLEQTLSSLVETSELGLANGVATERDVLLVKARLMEARQALADARAQLAGVKNSLADLTGATITTDTDFAGASASCAAAKEGALDPNSLHRPELDLLSAQSQLLDAKDQLERVADHPKVGLFATAGYGRPGLNVLSDSFDPFFIGGVRVSVPLTYLYAGTRKNAREQLSVQRSLVDRQKDSVMKQIQVQLDSKHAELSRYQEAVAIDDQVLGLRERARQQTELQLDNGTATMADLLSDLSQEDMARSKRAIHMAQSNLACRDLELIKGAL